MLLMFEPYYAMSGCQLTIGPDIHVQCIFSGRCVIRSCDETSSKSIREKTTHAILVQHVKLVVWKASHYGGHLVLHSGVSRVLLNPNLGSDKEFPKGQVTF